MIRFVLVDLDKLSTFSDIGSVCETMAETAAPIFFLAQSVPTTPFRPSCRQAITS